jgi:hypothetical protein
MTTLRTLVDGELHRPVGSTIHAAAQQLGRSLGGDAVLFYGSALRTDDLDGVLDFYVLRDTGSSSRPLPDFLWPHVSYHELDIGGQIVRAKVATMPLATFEAAARGSRIDTTIWTRFAQPSRLLVARSATIADRVADAVGASLRTASRFAAALGPDAGAPEDYWLALFRQTYGAELRVEKQGRADSILTRDPDYYRDALRLAWADLGLIGAESPAILRPLLDAARRRKWQAQWHRRRIAGKPLNALRLVKAAWTFDGATRYALWKIERHSGIAIALTPWRERHPLLAAPGMLFQLWRASGR